MDFNGCLRRENEQTDGKGMDEGRGRIGREWHRLVLVGIVGLVNSGRHA